MLLYEQNNKNLFSFLMLFSAFFSILICFWGFSRILLRLFNVEFNLASFVTNQNTPMVPKMKIYIKKLQGGECCVEVLPTTLISDMKRDVAYKLGVPVEEQKLLLLGRTLIDEHPVQSYPALKDGSRVHLVVKKPEGLYELAIKHFKKSGMQDTEAINAASRLMDVIEDKFNKLSWDDINKLAHDCMMSEGIFIDFDDGYRL